MFLCLHWGKRHWQDDPSGKVRERLRLISSTGTVELCDLQAKSKHIFPKKHHLLPPNPRNLKHSFVYLISLCFFNVLYGFSLMGEKRRRIKSFELLSQSMLHGYWPVLPGEHLDSWFLTLPVRWVPVSGHGGVDSDGRTEGHLDWSCRLLKIASNGGFIGFKSMYEGFYQKDKKQQLNVWS